MQPNNLPEAGSVAYWMRFAEGHLAFAHSQSEESILTELLCFHAQQAAEKAIKSVLVHFNIQVPRTHSIENVIDKASRVIDVPTHVHEAANLTPYANATRYPGNYEPRTRTDLMDAINKAEKVVSWAKSICL